MKENLTELVFILDRSGSMSGLEKDTVGGYNGFIAKQKTETGEALLSTVLFDDKYELLHDRADIKNVKPLTDGEYFVRGSTALLDAIGRTIDNVGRRLSETPEEMRPSKVLLVITTDGMENASREYSAQRVRSMIEHQKDKYSWEFLFLGANIDAVSAAQDLGIERDKAVRFCCDADGVSLNYQAVSAAVSCYRSSKKISDDWKCEIEKDYLVRSEDGETKNAAKHGVRPDPRIMPLNIPDAEAQPVPTLFGEINRKRIVPIAEPDVAVKSGLGGNADKKKK